jgi:hypothetical protein
MSSSKHLTAREEGLAFQIQDAAMVGVKHPGILMILVVNVNGP